jgi:hypothetical protein
MTFNRAYALDAATGLIKRAPGQAALTSDGYVGTQHDQQAATASDMVLVLNVESIVTNGATGETYKFYIIGSNVADRSDGEVLGCFALGKASQLTGSQETRDTVAGDRIVAPFRTEKNRTRYRYVDVYLDVAGTAPSIAFNANLSKEIC